MQLQNVGAGQTRAYKTFAMCHYILVVCKLLHISPHLIALFIVTVHRDSGAHRVRMLILHKQPLSRSAQKTLTLVVLWRMF